ELGSVAAQWESDTEVSALIPEDEFVKKGKKLSVSFQVQTDDGLLQEVDIEQDGSSPALIVWPRGPRLCIINPYARLIHFPVRIC
ncbi:MAG: hypothetical protein EZS28_051021, partial [Streblomastix strix]